MELGAEVDLDEVSIGCQVQVTEGELCVERVDNVQFSGMTHGIADFGLDRWECTVAKEPLLFKIGPLSIPSDGTNSVCISDECKRNVGGDR